MKKSTLPILILAAFLCFSTPSFAAPSFDVGNLTGHMKELVKRESRNKLLKHAGDAVETTNKVIALVNTTKQLFAPLSKSLTSVEEWFPVVPKSIAELLKEEKPDVDKVQAEIEKIILIDRKDSATLKKTVEQQRVLLLKIVTYAYAAAERSLDLSGDAYEETEKLKEKIEEHEDVVTHVRQMAVLQMFSTRKMAEILHLQSRMLEVDSMMGLIKKEKIEKTKEEEAKDDKKTETKSETAK